MKIITLERKTIDGNNVEYGIDENGEDYYGWWCVIETPEEEMVYDDFVEHLGTYGQDLRSILWNRMMIHAGQDKGLAWGDDDVYGYIRPDEDVPEVGEEFIDSEGDTWLRVA